MSSAHVYLRLPTGEGANWEEIPEAILEEASQLVKNNSIEGSKKACVGIHFTPWSNLKKTNNMEVGAVSFFDDKLCKNRKCEKNRELVKQIEKTRSDDQTPDLDRLRLKRDKAEREAKKALAKQAEKNKKDEERQRAEEREERSYDKLFEKMEDTVTTNKDLSEKYKDFNEFEDDFM
ncbi:hypothetical protein CYMTET_5415 [Cymbomonas tetramitiformis]|uniref:NFACT RNA-binding domain-containing protein n=1 Tax=Cymbomonas tetramitiformis TaxID=36881 RepID=A0AAE0GZD0_9CHLO|nr:hypothetical protein CYMTET_5415 [Cymbomonas tetramitiformis]